MKRVVSALAVATAISLVTLASKTVMSQNIVQNPGFEDGRGLGGQPPFWNASGGLWEVYLNVGPTYTHSGANSFLGAVDSGTGLTSTDLTQDLATSAGQQYTYSFWTWNEDIDNSSGDALNVLWNGSQIDSVDIANAGHFTQFSYTVTATGASTPIEFEMTQNADIYGDWLIDDVSVTSNSAPGVPEPGAVTGLFGALTLGGCALLRRRRTAPR